MLFLRVFFLFVFIFNSPLITKADTVSYYRIKHKGRELPHPNFSNKVDTFHFALQSVTGTDSISIAYFRDTPCSDCATTLTVDGEYGIAFSMMGVGTGKPLTFPMSYLVNQGFNTKVYSVYYSEEGKNTKKARILLCRIQIE